MSKGSNSSTTTSSPNAAALSGYYDVLGRANAAAGTPYEAYGGEFTAPINEQQQLGIGNINQTAGFALPYAQEGAQDVRGGVAGITGQDISQFYDPYQQQVIDATQAQFSHDNQVQQSQVEGNAAAQGALGGNRVGVAQALTAEGQQRSQAPVLAGLRSQGYQSALKAAMDQKNRQIQGGQTLAGVGAQGQQSALAGAGAQFGVGTAEQQTQQARDTALLQEFMRRKAYPFQTTQWLAGINTGVGSQLGGTSTTQGPEPNQWSQAAGLGLAGLSLFSDERLKEGVEEIGRLHDGQKIYRYHLKGDPTPRIGLLAQEVEKRHPEAVGERGGYKTVDYGEATDDAVERWTGGLVAGFADGGAPDMFGGVQSWVPTIGLTAGKGAPDGPKSPGGEGGGKGNAMSGFGANDLKGAKAGLGNIMSGVGEWWGENYGTGSSGSDSIWGAGGVEMPASSYELGGWRGGRMGRDEGGGVPVSVGVGGGSFDDMWNPMMSRKPNYSDPYAKELRQGLIDTGYNNPGRTQPMDDNSGDPVPEDRGPPPVHGMRTAGLPSIMTAGFGDRDEGDAMPYAARSTAGVGAAPTVGARSAPAGAGVAPNSEGMGGFNPLGLGDEARQGLISMGLGMMANRRGGKGSFLASMGEGGEQGMQTYSSAKSATQKLALERRKEAFEREKFDRPYRELSAAEKARQAREPWKTTPEGGLTFTPGGPHDPKTIAAEAAAKLPQSMMSSEAETAAADYYRMTGKLPPNMGRGVQGAMQATRIQNLAAEREQAANGDPSDWPNRWQQFGTRASGLRTLETRAANLTLAETEARSLVPRVRELLSKVDRTRFPDLNSLIIAAQKKTGNENEIKLGIAIGSLVNVYARVMKPVGQIGVSDTQNAQHLLEQKWSTGQIGAALDQFELELDSAKGALDLARKEYGSAGPSIKPKTEEHKPETKPESKPAAAAPNPQRQQALDWIAANPNDPRVPAIKQKLGVP